MAGYQNIASTRSKLSRPVRNVLYKLALYIIHSRLPEDKKKELPLPHNDKDLVSVIFLCFMFLLYSFLFYFILLVIYERFTIEIFV